MSNEKDNEIAENRFELISLLLAPNLCKQDYIAIRMEIAKYANISKKKQLIDITKSSRTVLLMLSNHLEAVVL
jgi:hypothetical protein